MKLTLLVSSLAAAPLVIAAGTTTDQGSTCSTTASISAGSDIVETAVAAGSFKTLAAALGAADLAGALKGEGPFTVFAPTDDAFAKLPEGTVENLLRPENKAQLASILTYHVVPGNVKAGDVVNLSFANTLNGQRIDVNVNEDGVFIDGAKVLKTDIACSNGTIHVIDSVILPSTKNVVETAVENGSFTILAKALGAAGLVDALQGEGPFTVFAPTDEAFKKLPAETLASLLQPENKDKLTAILTYHVVPGRVFASDARQVSGAKTLQGSKLSIKTKGDGLMIDGANVVAADIETSNGVIHVLDAVILPE